MAKKVSQNGNGSAIVKVVGVGGGGGNAVSRMSNDFTRGVEFIAVNTDVQDLDSCNVRNKIYIGRNLTKGLGTGMNPELGRQAAEENRSEIAEALQGGDLIFITAGMGGGTGTGGAPVIAEAAKQAGALTIAVVTKPFSFEGSQRSRIAQEGLMKLKDKVDALIVIPNDRIFSIINQDTSVVKAFESIDMILKNAVSGIVELIAAPGIINLDFADVRVIMEDAGAAIVGVGQASGKDRAQNAVTQAINSPLLEVTIDGAKGVLLGIAGGRDLRMTEINDIARQVAEAVDPSARIIFGAYHDKRLRAGNIKVTIIATGFNAPKPANSLFSNLYEKDKQSSAPAAILQTSYRAEGIKLTETDLDPEPKLDFKSIKAEVKTEPTEEEGDVWEVPAFMRRKKRKI
ncbi:MAG: cell division protein FtsZ [bacterium]|nr:cell division protein FtsZ [bacterium]